MAIQPFDLSNVSYVMRIVAGSNNPADLQSNEKIEEAMSLLNRCLTGQPKGKILGIERSFAILTIGEHNVVLQWLTYHVGFPRKPFWVEPEA